MAYPIRFEKSDAEQWLRAIASAQPLALPASGEWSCLSMTTLAGVLNFAILSHGPVHHQLSPEQEKRLPREHREARAETLFQDVSDAIAFNGQLAELVQDNDFDAPYEPVVEGVIYSDENGKNVIPGKGFRGE
jgi:hypothetical protein